MNIQDDVFEDILNTLQHARIFISSREKMAQTGIDLYDELLEKLNRISSTKNRPALSHACPTCTCFLRSAMHADTGKGC